MKIYKSNIFDSNQKEIKINLQTFLRDPRAVNLLKRLEKTEVSAEMLSPDYFELNMARVIASQFKLRGVILNPDTITKIGQGARYTGDNDYKRNTFQMIRNIINLYDVFFSGVNTDTLNFYELLEAIYQDTSRDIKPLNADNFLKSVQSFILEDEHFTDTHYDTIFKLSMLIYAFKNCSKTPIENICWTTILNYYLLKNQKTALILYLEVLGKFPKKSSDLNSFSLNFISSLIKKLDVEKYWTSALVPLTDEEKEILAKIIYLKEGATVNSLISFMNKGKHDDEKKRFTRDKLYQMYLNEMLEKGLIETQSTNRNNRRLILSNKAFGIENFRNINDI